ncbi:MAG: methyltransferase [Oscillospiraceae bacterium]|nr:methyltransferase [Oscillospiraceae bacterium]
METILEDERLDDLKCAGLFLLQKKHGFRFGMDSVLLVAFAAEKRAARVFDIGAGSGVIPILMSARLPSASFDAAEIQQDIADMARRSVHMNRLDERVNIRCADARDLPEGIPLGVYDLVTCNPPYQSLGSALLAPDHSVRASRAAISLTLPDVAQAAAKLLRTAGRLCVVVPAHKFLECCDAMRERRIEPKRVRLVCDRAEKPPYLALIEGMRSVRPGLAFLPPLIAHESDGSPTAALMKCYEN